MGKVMVQLVCWLEVKLFHYHCVSNVGERKTDRLPEEYMSAEQLVV